MVSSFLLQLVFVLSSLTSNSVAILRSTHCSTSGNYTTGSIFESNLKQLLSSLLQNTLNNNNFFNDTSGEVPYQAYGLAMCHYDFSLDSCMTCLSNANGNITLQCPYSTSATIWFDECFIRYSNRYFFSVASTDPTYLIKNLKNVSDPVAFDQILGALMDKLTVDVTTSSNLLAGGHANYTSQQIYALLECTRDLHALDCQKCVKTEVGWIEGYCKEAIGCRLYGANCYLRYEPNSFYNLIPHPPSPSPLQQPSKSPLLPPVPLSPSPTLSSPPALPPIETVISKEKKRHVTTSIIIGVACSIALGLLIIVLVLLWIKRQRRNTANNVASIETNFTDSNTIQEPNNGRETKLKMPDFKTPREPSNEQETELKTSDSKRQQEPSIGQETRLIRSDTLQEPLMMFNLNTLREATNNFLTGNMIGEGGFGQVFKATLKNGKNLAVKRLATTSKQGITELINEVELTGRLTHRNLVQVLGYCIQEKEKLLCYEYLPNGSLDKIIFPTDVTSHRMLDWKSRFNIIKGICRGLFYLHVDSGTTIIHRDLKPGNILLDENMNPKISDFGTSRLFEEGQTRKIITNLVGTIGYIAPECYDENGVFTVKSDVFSLGVIILEIVTGVRWNTGIISRIWRQWSEGKASELIDPLIPNMCLKLDQVELSIRIGLLCVNINPEKRPSILEVYDMLNGTLSPLAPKDPREFDIH